jgi:hypothetical protein
MNPKDDEKKHIEASEPAFHASAPPVAGKTERGSIVLMLPREQPAWGPRPRVVDNFRRLVPTAWRWRGGSSNPHRLRHNQRGESWSPGKKASAARTPSRSPDRLLAISTSHQHQKGPIQVIREHGFN